MLCDKCQKNEATVQVTTILHGKGEETMQLCTECDAEATGLPTFDPSKLQAVPVVAGKCEFCGKDAFSGKTLAGDRSIYWCFDCEAEYRRTLAELFFAEQAELMKIVKTRASFLPFRSPQQLQAWLAEAGQRVVLIMKQRRQKKC